MKDLILLSMLIYALCSIYTGGLQITFYIVIAISTFYVIRFVQLKQFINKKDYDKYKTLCEERSFFADTLNHDLKVPILAQLRGIELLQNEILGSLNEEQKKLTEQIINSCNCVLKMISMNVNAYDIDNNSYNLIYEKFNLSDIIISCFEEVSKEANDKHIDLSYLPLGDDTRLEADKTEIKKVIINLLLNAIDYSNKGGRIAIKTFSDKQRIIMSISGIEHGIDEKYNTIGHSIGMNLSKKIIEYHNGKIYIPKCGNLSNTYTFILPKNSEQKYRHLCPI